MKLYTLILIQVAIIFSLFGCNKNNKDVTNEQESLFMHPSSAEVIGFASEKAKEIEIKTTNLGKDIYGTLIPQGRKIGNNEYKWFCSKDNHDLTMKSSDELAQIRHGMTWMAYRKHWGAQSGWKDHVYNPKICSNHSVDAAKVPQSDEEWKSGDVTVGIRLLFPNTEESVKEGTRRLRKCATICLEFAKQNDIADNLKIELFLDLYEASSFPSAWSFPGTLDDLDDDAIDPTVQFKEVKTQATPLTAQVQKRFENIAEAARLKDDVCSVTIIGEGLIYKASTGMYSALLEDKNPTANNTESAALENDSED